MKRILVILILCAALVSCKKETPSYVGKWVYVESDPDIGEQYKGSYFEVARNWDYYYYDASTGEEFGGDSGDYEKSGTTSITLTSKRKGKTRVYNVELKRLKDGVMIIETSDITGELTSVTFNRE